MSSCPTSTTILLKPIYLLMSIWAWLCSLDISPTKHLKLFYLGDQTKFPWFWIILNKHIVLSFHSIWTQMSRQFHCRGKGSSRPKCHALKKRANRGTTYRDEKCNWVQVARNHRSVFRPKVAHVSRLDLKSLNTTGSMRKPLASPGVKAFWAWLQTEAAKPAGSFENQLLLS